MGMAVRFPDYGMFTAAIDATKLCRIEASIPRGLTLTCLPVRHAPYLNSATDNESLGLSVAVRIVAQSIAQIR